MLRIESAGTRAVVGAEIHPASVRALSRLGGDPAGFRARQLTDAMVVGADLILTMTRDHRRQVLARDPRALSRTFTLREAAGLLDLLGTETDTADTGSGERLRAMVGAMARARAYRPSSADDDVLDPIGHPEEVHAEMGQVVVDALLPVLDRVAAAVRTPSTGPVAGRSR